MRVEFKPIFIETRQFDCSNGRAAFIESPTNRRLADKIRVLLLAADTIGLRIIPSPSSLADSRLICPSRKCGLNVKEFFVIKN